jgi:hypothetical protein
MEGNNPLHFPLEMIDMFAEIAKQQEAQFRQCKIMLAGFKVQNTGRFCPKSMKTREVSVEISVMHPPIWSRPL